MPRVEIRDVHELRRQIGRELAVSEWLTIPQERIDLFAQATGYRQPGDLAQGLLILSLLPRLAADTLVLPEAKLSVNYGLNSVRFPWPARAGQRIRARFSPAAIEDVASGVQLTWSVTIEVEGGEKPACVAETVSRRYAR